MHVEPRSSPIDLLVVHVNVGPEVEGGARGLAHYLQTINAGYHAVHDSQETIELAGDDQLVYGAGGVNERSLHSCIIGYADQTAAQWRDLYSIAAIHQAAVWAATKCRAHALPITKLGPAQVARVGTKGICGHADVSAIYPASEGHYDPGPNFPWSVYLDSVQQTLNPLVFILPRPLQYGGGAWWAHARGNVDFISSRGGVVHGGMLVDPRDRIAFAGRTAAKLELRPYKHLGMRRMGYTLIATSGERYVPRGQH